MRKQQMISFGFTALAITTMTPATTAVSTSLSASFNDDVAGNAFLEYMAQGTGASDFVSPYDEASSIEYSEPEWFETYSSLYSGVKKCQFRPEAPLEGERCSASYKLCFFGDQLCTDDGLMHPEEKCECTRNDGEDFGRWRCTKVNCHSCPVEVPSLESTGETCTGDLTCLYGSEKCCGEAHPKVQCGCLDGTLTCRYADMCLFPSCMFKTYNNLVGETCFLATERILLDYPGMEVSCVPNLPDHLEQDFDSNRVYILVDGDNLVRDVPKVG